MSSVLAGIAALVFTSGRAAQAASPWRWGHHRSAESCPDTSEEYLETGALGGTWYWLHSPEEEKRIVTGLFNRCCIRCHDVSGRGTWDIPGIPNFTDGRWQASRSDAQLARIILEGRGAVMPPFRGALSLEEAWAMARYLRTFMPPAETPRPTIERPMLPADPLPPKTNGLPK
jgi:hypothetical protein